MLKSYITKDCCLYSERPYPKLMQAKLSGNIYFVSSKDQGVCIYKNTNYTGASQNVGTHLTNINNLSDFTGTLKLSQD